MFFGRIDCFWYNSFILKFPTQCKDHPFMIFINIFFRWNTELLQWVLCWLIKLIEFLLELNIELTTILLMECMWYKKVILHFVILCISQYLHTCPEMKWWTTKLLLCILCNIMKFGTLKWTWNLIKMKSCQLNNISFDLFICLMKQLFLLTISPSHEQQFIGIEN